MKRVRLAIREESQRVVAYLAGEDNMAGAITLSMLSKDLADDETTFRLWREVLQQWLVRGLEAAGHPVHHVETRPAPEDEIFKP